MKALWSFLSHFNKSNNIKSKHVWDCMLNISLAIALWRYISPKSKYYSNTDSEQVVWTTFEKQTERLFKSTWNLINDKGKGIKFTAYNSKAYKRSVLELPSMHSFILSKTRRFKFFRIRVEGREDLLRQWFDFLRKLKIWIVKYEPVMELVIFLV